jgi:DNA-binding HxlR family transcriptional regulator
VPRLGKLATLKIFERRAYPGRERRRERSMTEAGYDARVNDADELWGSTPRRRRS